MASKKGQGFLRNQTKSKVVGVYRRRERRRVRFSLRFTRRIFYFATLALLGGGFFYFFFVSSYFKITNVEILGVESISQEEVQSGVENVFAQKKLGFFNSKNYFLAPVEKLQASLLEQFPKIGIVSLEKIYRNTLQVHIEERVMLGVWCLASRDRLENCFYFDKEGVIFEEAPKSFGSLMMSVEDRRDIEANLGSAVLGGEQVAFAQDAQGLVSRNFPFSIQTFLITKAGEYEILTSEGWRVFLNKSAGVEYQLSNLKYVLDEKIKTRRGELEYADLRLGNKVYYKYRSGVD